MTEDVPQRVHSLREVFNLARDYERPPETPARFHFLALAILMLRRFVDVMAQGS
jgi:hypothetical protein